jgi:IS30 family transposase
MRTYAQLTQEQRSQIYALKNTGPSYSEIAEVIGVHKSTRSRELKRNRGQRGYRPQPAQSLAMERRPKGVPRITVAVWAQVERLLKQDWSPAQISGRLKKEQRICISQEWIDHYVLQDKRAGADRYRHLRCQKKRRKRYGTDDRRGQLPNGCSIEERPALVNDRKRLGDWEVDPLMGRRHKPAWVTRPERKSRFPLLGKVPQRTAPAVQNQIHRLLLPVADQVPPLTSEHGKQFADHPQIAEMFQLKFYFAHPAAAWERSTHENTNGLRRQYFPNKHNFQWLSHKEIEPAMLRLNFRPPKSLRFKTPFEVFFHSSVALIS